MPPKKYKAKTKTKSKRYSCDLCTDVDNTLMIQCDDCQSRYHLKCLNIESIHEDDEWVCVECVKKGKTHQSSISSSNSNENSVRDQPMQGNASKSQVINATNSKAEGHRESNSQSDRRSRVNSQSDTKNRRQDVSNENSMRNSQVTRSSVQRRTRIELDRIEEERELQERRDKEYLDKKYRLMLECCSDRSERTSSEKRSTDRSSFTKEWVKSQFVVQPVQEKPSIKPQTTALPPIIKLMDSRIPLEERERFARKFDEVVFKTTSPDDRIRESAITNHQSKSSSQTRPMSHSTLLHGPKNQSLQSKPTLAENQNREKPSCPAHDARRFMFRDIRERVGIPCSNSTFVQSQKPNSQNKGEGDFHPELPSPDILENPTLEWDNYVENQRLTYDRSHKPSTMWRDYGKTTKADNQCEPPKGAHSSYSVSFKEGSLFNADSHDRSNERERYRNSKSSYRGNETNFGEDETVHTISDKEDEQSFNEPIVIEQTLNRRSTNDQSQRKVEFTESHRRNLSGMSTSRQPSINLSSAQRMDDTIMPNQIAARHVVEKKLPNFYGDTSEWPIWYTQYKNSTKLCGYSNGENLDRLQRCIQGKARDKVKGRLTHPDSVPWIIDTLEMLYGRPEVIIKDTINKIREYPPVKADKLDDLITFAFEVQTIYMTIDSLNCLNHLRDPMLIEDLVDKLPTQEKKEWAIYKSKQRNITLKTLSDWLYDLAKLLSTVVTPKISKPYNDRKSTKDKSDVNEKAIGLEHVNVHVNRTSNAVGNGQGERQDEKKNFPCPICNNECIKVENCSKFKSFDVDARWKALNDHRLCRKCLRKHKNQCRATTICGKNGCQFKHHFLLHNDQRHTQSKNNSSANTTRASSNLHAITNVSTLLRIVPVILYNGAKSVATFAFFDEGTTVTMMEKRVADELGLSGTSEQICLIWTKKIHRNEKAERVSLEISGVDQFNKRYELKGVRTVDELYLPSQSMNRDELVAKYQYLKNVPFVDYNNATPGIMIGSDMPKLGSQLQVIESEDVENYEFNGPMASKTRLGWSVHGPRNASTMNVRVNAHQFEICPHHNELDNEVHQRIKDYFSVENFGVQANSKFQLESKDNERAREMLNRLTRKVNGQYETGLLWKSDDIILPDSYPMALKRLASLEKQGVEMVRILGAKIADYVAKGYARKLTKKELEYDGPVWYLPLFGVVHPKKPGKVRMVFDAAAKTKSVSLNSVLLKGPDLYTSLIDILRRFRERLYTGGGDIAEMFHQVNIIEKDRHFQRFLFRDDSTKEPDVYEMGAMTFGASCSPCSAQFVKNENASEFNETHPRAVSAIVDSHYVDDMMDCEHTEAGMIQLLQDVKMIHAKGGFTIRNFISNSKNVLKALGENGSNETKDIELKTELKTERILGMWYDTRSDIFTFSLKYTLIDEKIFDGSRQPTKREILRTLMSIFDPLGFLSNFLVYLKILLQEVWRTQMDWDEQLSTQNLIERWKRWLAILPEVENVKIPRLYSPKMSPNSPKSIQMHVFVDASEDAFATVVYLRIEDDKGVDVSFAGSKARVAPIKYLSIPRKELQGSVLGTRFSTSIKDAQRFPIDKRIFWCDSSTVISWLNSDHRKYSQFVAHRVGEILENSDVNEWRWIPTKENVADEATKWSTTPNFDSNNRWFNAPHFLRQSEDQWPEKKKIVIDVEEEMKANYIHSSLVLPKIIDPERFSNYKRMVRSLAYAIRFRNLFNGKAKRGEPLKQDELRRAENLIFRQAQFEGYPTEMVTLERNNVLPVDKQKFIDKSSPLHDGTPYLDADGVLRMKWRTDGARELSMDAKRPIVLPKNSRITTLVLLEYHSKYFIHQNHETVVNEVRQKFYIPRLREVLKRTRKGCQTCKIKKAHPAPPQMANLPNARLATRFAPFSYVGIDFFGPLKVTVGRRTEKRWGVMFTCLTIRAIHIEIASGLDTNSCILCIQNFTADHGPVIEFHSDCGTNFKGADNELRREVEKIDFECLQVEFTTSYTKWIFNPPASPHMGGSWERMILSAKSAMDQLMPTRTPKEDMLRNVFKLIQNMINSRPLTYIPLDGPEDEALTPNHFIKLSSNGLKPPCEIELDGSYLRESWKESQRLIEIFWKRFVKEYLPTLKRRTKWHKKVEPLKQGDLVLIVDENSPRNTYPKARIVKTQMGSNGQVRRAKVEIISSTKSNPKGQITKVSKIELWRSAHKLALLDVASSDCLAQAGADRETGGSVDATGFKSNSATDKNNVTGSIGYASPANDIDCHRG